MSRISELIRTSNHKLLNVYCTAGYPGPDHTLAVLQALQESGADMIELGMPYSDPLADGPVIQHSSSVALSNGMTISRLFSQLQSFRSQIHVPVILMGYMNPVLQYGFEDFCRSAAAVGIDGLILPDLPAFEFQSTYGPIIRKYGLDFIFLVTPETSDERVRLLDSLSSGFLYAVSSSSTTGSEKEQPSPAHYLDRLRGLSLQNPVLVGFGIKDRDSFEAATEHAAGAIIGSAYIKALGDSPDIAGATRQFLEKIRPVVHNR